MVGVIGPRDLSERLKGTLDSLVLLDVREEDERRLARIEPSLFIPMNQVPHRLTELPRDRDIIVYCHSGTRSALVAGFLESQGFSRVRNLTGGIDAWSRLVDPSVPRYS